MSSGINAGLGLNFAIYPGVVVNADAMTVRSQRVYDKLTRNVALGRRDEADAHIAFDLTDRIVDLIVGYRQRSYVIDSEDQSFKEQSQGAYAGMRLGIYF